MNSTPACICEYAGVIDLEPSRVPRLTNGILARLTICRQDKWCSPVFLIFTFCSKTFVLIRHDRRSVQQRPQVLMSALWAG